MSNVKVTIDFDEYMQLRDLEDFRQELKEPTATASLSKISNTKLQILLYNRNTQVDLGILTLNTESDMDVILNTWKIYFVKKSYADRDKNLEGSSIDDGTRTDNTSNIKS